MKIILPNILSLDIGAKRLGVAVFENERLVFYAVKSIAKRNRDETSSTVEKALTNLTADYEIQVIAVEQLIYLQQQRSAVTHSFEQIKRFARIKNIRLVAFNPLLVRQIICQNKSANKKRTFQIVSQMYSELRKYEAVSEIWQQAYYAYLLNAVALGLVCLKELKTQQGRQTHLKNLGEYADEQF